MLTFFRKSVNGSDGFIANYGHRKWAGTHSWTVNVDGTSAALGNTAAILCSDQVEMVSQHPQHRCSRVDVFLLFFSIDIKVKDCHDGKNYKERILKIY